MANHKSAIKRAKQNEVSRIRNRGYKSRVRKSVKEVRTAIGENAGEQAVASLKKAVSILQKTASRGIIHRNQAARKIARLSRQVHQLTITQG